MGANNVKRFEFRLGKWGLGLFVGGMSLLVFLSFLFGVMVGKDLDAYPEKYSWGIARQLTGSTNSTGIPAAPRTVVAVKEAAKEHPVNENAEYDLSFYETLSKKSAKLKTQPSGDEGAQIEQPALSGERTAPHPATPPAPVHAVGLLPGNKPLPEKKRVMEKKETSRTDKIVAASLVESEKKAGSKSDEKHIETRFSEKKTVHPKEKSIPADVRNKKTDPKTSRNIAEKSLESRPLKTVAEKKADQPLNKSRMAEKKVVAGTDKKSAEKRTEQKVEQVAAAEKKQEKKNLNGKEINKGDKKQTPEKKKYMAQVASYREKAKAEQVAGKLKAMGYTPHVVPMELPGKGRWYRITISGMPSHDKAKEALSNVEKKLGGSKGFVRAEGDQKAKTASAATVSKKKNE